MCVRCFENTKKNTLLPLQWRAFRSCLVAISPKRIYLGHLNKRIMRESIVEFVRPILPKHEKTSLLPLLSMVYTQLLNMRQTISFVGFHGTEFFPWIAERFDQRWETLSKSKRFLCILLSKTKQWIFPPSQHGIKIGQYICFAVSLKKYWALELSLRYEGKLWFTGNRGGDPRIESDNRRKREAFLLLAKRLV